VGEEEEAKAKEPTRLVASPPWPSPEPCQQLDERFPRDRVMSLVVGGGVEGRNGRTGGYSCAGRGTESFDRHWRLFCFQRSSAWRGTRASHALLLLAGRVSLPPGSRLYDFTAGFRESRDKEMAQVSLKRYNVARRRAGEEIRV